MKKKRLSESMEIMLTVEPNLHIVTENMLAAWGGIPYAELSVILVHLKFLAEIHQNHHWTCMGDPFYGDHLLFQRLYDGVKGEIDTVAEKAVGMGSTSNVDLMLTTSQLLKLLSGYKSSTTIPHPSDLARRSLTVEMTFIKVIDHLIDCLAECGMLTNGIDNMLQGIADAHEGHVYLLKQRCARPIM